MKFANKLQLLVIHLCLVAIIFIDLPVARYISSFIILLCTITIGFALFKARTGPDTNHQINSVEKTNSDAINAELKQLFELLETSIKEDLVVVRQELQQIKNLINNAVVQLTDSFYKISTNSDEQTRLIHEVTNALETYVKQETISALDDTSNQIKTNSDIAIRSLQFEDIVVQVSDNSLQYIDNLDKFLDEFNKRLVNRIKSSSTSVNASDLIRSFVSDVKAIRQDIQLPDRKAVHQNNLAEGGIELF